MDQVELQTNFSSASIDHDFKIWLRHFVASEVQYCTGSSHFTQEPYNIPEDLINKTHVIDMGACYSKEKRMQIENILWFWT